MLRKREKLSVEERELHERFSECGRNAKEWLRKCAMILPEIDRKKIWRKRGFLSIYEYAANIAGMSKNSVREALRVMKGIEDKPELIKVVRKRGINAVRPVVTVATKETEKFWAEKAKTMGQHSLEAFVREFKKLDGVVGTMEEEELTGMSVSGENKKSHRAVTFEITLSPETAAKILKLKENESWEKVIAGLLAVKEEFEKTKPEKVETDSKHIPVEIQRFVVARAGGFCAFPGCEKEYEHLHHTARFSLKKEHSPDTIVPLCGAHHALVHAGLIANEDDPPAEWRIRERADVTDLKFVVDSRVMENVMQKVFAEGDELRLLPVKKVPG